MKVVLQRVSRASVIIKSGSETKPDRTTVERGIGHGLMVLLGIGPHDKTEDRDYIIRKITQLRIFPDDREKMNLSVKDVEGEILIVSQFTLYGDTKKGNRPSFNGSAPPEIAIPLYEDFVTKLEEVLGKKVTTGEFGAHMEVELVNDGPVTIVMDSRDR